MFPKLLLWFLVSFLFKKNKTVYILGYGGIKNDNRLKLIEVECLQFRK